MPIGQLVAKWVWLGDAPRVVSAPCGYHRFRQPGGRAAAGPDSGSGCVSMSSCGAAARGCQYAAPMTDRELRSNLEQTPTPSSARACRAIGEPAFSLVLAFDLSVFRNNIQFLVIKIAGKGRCFKFGVAVSVFRISVHLARQSRKVRRPARRSRILLRMRSCLVPYGQSNPSR